VKTLLAVLRGIGAAFCLLALLIAGIPVVAVFLLAAGIVAAYFAVTEWLDERRVRRARAREATAIDFTERMRTRLADELKRGRN